METVQLDEVQIDRCKKCGGLWFDEFELADLQAKEGSEKVDTGHANKSTQRSQLRLNCPKCTAPMLRMVDAHQPHIWYETCDVCGGSFLDAGEFKNMVQPNLVDRIKDLLIELKGGRSTNTAKLSPAVLRKILQ
jgi:Zn-finger nucleic acid-binding protein